MASVEKQGQAEAAVYVLRTLYLHIELDGQETGVVALQFDKSTVLRSTLESIDFIFFIVGAYASF